MAELITNCPFCGEQHEVATGVLGMDRAIPDTGDVAFCFNCGEFAVFDMTMPGLLRRPNAIESVRIGYDAEFRKMRHAWEAIRNEPVQLP